MNDLERRIDDLLRDYPAKDILEILAAFMPLNDPKEYK